MEKVIINKIIEIDFDKFQNIENENQKMKDRISSIAKKNTKSLSKLKIQTN
jgi:hypothetical protein